MEKTRGVEVYSNTLHGYWFHTGPSFRLESSGGVESPNGGLWFWTGAPCSPKRTPGFPVEIPGVDELHAAFLNESRTRGCRWRPVQEIRVYGPKKMGAALSNAPVTNGVKAFENTIFGPCTLGRTWGTRPGKRAYEEPLFVAKDREGIDASGAECGNQAGRERYQNEQHGDSQEGYEVAGTYSVD
jgi:hypothetical protein